MLVRARRRRSSGRLAVLAVGLVAGAVALAGLSVGPARAAGSGSSAVTVTQTDATKHAWDPTTKTLVKKAPSVTVAQTQNLTNEVVHVSWKNFTPSRTLSGNPGFVPSGTLYAVAIYQCKGIDPTTSPYDDKQNGTETDCYRYGPTDGGNATDGAGNAVTTFTAANGTGAADIAVETFVENSFLACSTASPCSLVVVPEFGGAVPNKYSATACANHKGDSANGNPTALDTKLGSPCSWADRLTVPISFAPGTGACPSSTGSFAGGGSPMLERAMDQWRPAWCTETDPVTFGYDSGINEYEARAAFVDPALGLSRQLDVATTSQPATPDQASQRAFTYAPLANTGVAIAFVIDDDSTGRQVTDLKLNARLVAKLLTQSYSLRYGSCPATNPVQSPTCDPAVAGNPVTILADPEFRALNPGWASYATGTTAQLSEGTFLPTVLSGDSDLTYALTRWIASDKDAAAFLAGTKDPYGMHVNTYYKDPGYPVSSLQNLDPGYTASGEDAVPGNGTMQVAWSPISGLSNVAETLLGDRSTALDVANGAICDGVSPCHYAKVTPESTGQRLLFAVVDEGEAAAFRFPTASLENAAGRFVKPTTASIAAGIAEQVPNPDGITAAESESTPSAAAYPVAVTDYAMVPTCGLTAPVASAVVRMLDLASTTGQQPGLAPGQLNPGYTPLSAAQSSQVTTAAAQVRAQNRCLSAGGSPTPGASSPLSADDGDSGTSGATGTDGSESPAAEAAAAAAEAASTTPVDASADPVVAANTSAGRKYGVGGNRPSLIVPVLVAGAVVLLLGGPGGWFLITAESTPAWLRRLRTALPFTRTP